MTPLLQTVLSSLPKRNFNMSYEDLIEAMNKAVFGEKGMNSKLSQKDEPSVSEEKEHVSDIQIVTCKSLEELDRNVFENLILILTSIKFKAERGIIDPVNFDFNLDFNDKEVVKALLWSLLSIYIDTCSRAIREQIMLTVREGLSK